MNFLPAAAYNATLVFEAAISADVIYEWQWIAAAAAAAAGKSHIFIEQLIDP
jgi:hypothetical protein